MALEFRSCLAALPVSVLDITAWQAETFSVWGIRNVAALAALPENEHERQRIKTICYREFAFLEHLLHNEG
jgi:hypothetical protein